MSSSLKQILISVAVIAAALPFAASAQSADTDKLAQIQSLLAQIRALQEQVKSLVGSSTPELLHSEVFASSTPPGMMTPGKVGKMLCVALTRNLGPGSQGDDVKSLQEMLAQDPQNGFASAPTGFFGPKTAEAMKRFQMMNGIASTTTGFVGPMTRGFFERRCGKGLGQGDGGEGQGMGMMGARPMQLQLLPRGERYHTQDSNTEGE